jgi:hypothetical protein
MKTQALLLLLAVLPLAGCRNKQMNNQLVQRELRLQEDRIYELEDMLGEAEMIVESSRRENEALKQELSGGDPGPAPVRSAAPRTSSGSAPRPSTSRPSRSGPPDVDSGTLEAPEIDLGTPEEGGGIESGGELMPGPEDSGAVDGEIGPVEILPDDATPLSDARVSKLIVNRRLTGGINRDDHPGDDGLMLVCEPRDAQGELVKAPADVSIALIDPSKSGAAARVARWDFKGDETPQHFHKTPLGTGLHFELPWPSSPPSAEKLKLFVRYTGPHGDKVVTEMPLSIDPSGDKRMARKKARLQQAAAPKNWSSPRTAMNGSSRVPHSRVPLGRPATGPLADRGMNDSSLASRRNSGRPDDIAERPSHSIAAPNERGNSRDSWQPDRNSQRDEGSGGEDVTDGPDLASARRQRESDSSRYSSRSDTSTASRPAWKPYR